jgi:hypothetical protein
MKKKTIRDYENEVMLLRHKIEDLEWKLVQEKASHTLFCKEDVIFQVSGGMIDLVQKPIGITVHAVDYDIEGDEGTYEDLDGSPYRLITWKEEDLVESRVLPIKDSKE